MLGSKKLGEERALVLQQASVDRLELRARREGRAGGGGKRFETGDGADALQRIQGAPRQDASSSVEATTGRPSVSAIIWVQAGERSKAPPEAITSAGAPSAEETAQ